MDEMALRDCPNTQISMDKKAVTTPTAAKDSVAFTEICPTMAASVRDKIGSEIPAMMAGTASLLMCLRLIGVSNSTIFRVLFFVPRFCCYCFYFSDPISPLFFVSACLTVLFPKNLLLIIGLFRVKCKEKT